jgi:hypothetical protein
MLQYNISVRKYIYALRHQFMERESSLPCSQDLASGPCPEPDEFHFNILTSTPDLPSGHFLKFPTKTLYAFMFSPMHATCSAHSHFIILSLIGFSVTKI